MKHNDTKIVEMEAIAKGHVQGVGFRALVRTHAKVLKLKGQVKNLEDGSVKIWVQGTKPQLDEFLQKLNENTYPEQIKEIIIEYGIAKDVYDDFSIIR